jgi:hypothetical protein
MKNRIVTTILLICLLMACNSEIIEPGDGPPAIPENYGSLEFRFILPNYQIPKTSLHRVSLSFAYSVDSLYRSEFFKKVNITDYQEVYSLLFLPDEYYYLAVITCSCAGDTCLNGGFPGGQFGMKHNFNKFAIANQQTTIIETHFQ